MRPFFVARHTPEFISCGAENTRNYTTPWRVLEKRARLQDDDSICVPLMRSNTKLIEIGGACMRPAWFHKGIGNVDQDFPSRLIIFAALLHPAAALLIQSAPRYLKSKLYAYRCHKHSELIKSKVLQNEKDPKKIPTLQVLQLLLFPKLPPSIWSSFFSPNNSYLQYTGIRDFKHDKLAATTWRPTWDQFSTCITYLRILALR